MDEPFKTFYRLSEDIRLPPRILCRDVGVELYLRLGQWEKARIAIAKCAAAGAYTDGGREAVEHCGRYRRAAELTLNFLTKNPGYLQKNIYRALPEADKDCLKSFTRSSYLIRKEPCGKTNKLFANKNFEVTV